MGDEKIRATAGGQEVVEGGADLRDQVITEQELGAAALIEQMGHEFRAVEQFASVGPDGRKGETFSFDLVAIDSGSSDGDVMAAGAQGEGEGEIGVQVAERAEGI